MKFKKNNDMSTGWENHEPAPLEFFHGKLMDVFHATRKSFYGDKISISIDGTIFNKMIAEAKRQTYEKYKNLDLDKPVLKSDLEKKEDL